MLWIRSSAKKERNERREGNTAMVKLFLKSSLQEIAGNGKILVGRKLQIWNELSEYENEADGFLEIMIEPSS